LRGVEISSIFMKYRGRAVLDDFKKIAHIVVEIPLRTHSRPSTQLWTVMTKYNISQMHTEYSH
jgi:hypothetical protein